MKTKYANLSILLGVAFFLIGTVTFFLGRLEVPLNYVLPALGLILIGFGAAGKRHSIKER